MKNTTKIIMLLAFVGASFITVPVSAGKDKYLPVSSTSEEAKTAYHEAVKLMNNAHGTKSVNKLNEALEADPQFFMAHAHRALAASGNEKSEKADAYIEQTLALPQDNLTPAEEIIRKMIVNIKDSRSSQSKTNLKPLCDQLVNEFPNTIQSYEIASAVSNFIEKDTETSFAYMQKLVEIEPDYAPAYNSIGYYWMGKKEMDKAETAFKNYLRLAPDEPNAHDSMGEFYMESGNFAKSVEHYDQAVAMGMEGADERAEKAKNLAEGIDTEEDLEAEPDIDNN